MATLVACLLVVGVWGVLGTGLVGVGRLTRRLVTGTLAGWGIGDFWTGLAVSISLVFLAHLVLPVTSWWWLALGPAALTGLVLGPRPLRRLPPVLWLVLGAVVLLYVADRALQPITATDSGLYHLPMLDWLHRYAAVPGLGNFHGRLGYNTGSLMFTALVGTVVPTAIAAHFANSLLMAVLCLEVLLAVRSLTRPGLTASSYAPAIVLVLAAPALLLPMHASGDISSPSLDLPALVVTLAAALYVARAVGDPTADPAVLVPAVALLALLPVIRVQLGVFSALAGSVIVASLAVRTLSVPRPRRLLPGLAGLGVLIVGSWAGHGLVLTGYPVFPATALGIPVSWRVPAAYGRLEQDWISSWARQPGQTPAQVLHSSAWIKPWAARTVAALDVRGMLALAGLGVILAGAILLGGRLVGRRRAAVVVSAVAVSAGLLLVLHWAGRYPLPLLRAAAVVFLGAPLLLAVRPLLRPRRPAREARAVTLVGVAGAGTLVAWYVLAPDPRFVTGALWITAAVPAAAALSWLWPRRRRLALVGLVSCVVVAGAYPAVELQQLHQLGPIHATTAGRWGMPAAPPGQVKPVLANGVVINIPVSGDECWAGTLPCTPDPTRPWRLRTPGRLSGGFVMTRSSLP